MTEKDYNAGRRGYSGARNYPNRQSAMRDGSMQRNYRAIQEASQREEKQTHSLTEDEQDEDVSDTIVLTEKKQTRKKQNDVLKEILSNSLYLLFVLVLTLLIVRYVGQRTVVIGSSMEPMLSNQDNLIVDKITYRFREPERFDIIVFPFEYEEDTYYIKRIIGLPGETVRIDENGNIYIKAGADAEEVLLEEHYGAEVMKDPGLAYLGITLGEGEYFVLGDNRNHSSDSRTPAVGLIHEDDIVGRAWLRIYPFDSIGFVRHQ